MNNPDLARTLWLADRCICVNSLMFIITICGCIGLAGNSGYDEKIVTVVMVGVVVFLPWAAMFFFNAYVLNRCKKYMCRIRESQNSHQVK